METIEVGLGFKAERINSFPNRKVENLRIVTMLKTGRRVHKFDVMELRDDGYEKIYTARLPLSVNKANMLDMADKQMRGVFDR